MRRTLLVTIATPEILGDVAAFIENQKEYATARGFEYRIKHKPWWKDLHASFSKVWEIHCGLCQGFDQVIWTDADVAFMDMQWDITSLLDENHWMAAYKQTNWNTWDYLCNGLIVLRNCPESRDYVEKWVKKVETRFIKDHPWEQWYFDELIRDIKYQGVRRCVGAEIGCFCPELWHDGTIWQPGYPTIHFAGPSDWKKRGEVFRTVYQSQVKR